MINSELFRILPKLKICGLTKYEDLQFCLEQGVDFIGFNFHPGSKRYIEVENAASQWAQVCTKFKQTQPPVLVVVDLKEKDIRKIAELFPQGFILQLHGGQGIEEIDSLLGKTKEVTFWQAIGVDDVLPQLTQVLHPQSSLCLFDKAPQASEFGGMGKSFSWELLENLKLDKTWGLAGGIKVENIRSALQTGAQLIDVASGAESSPGIKDQTLIQQMVDCVNEFRQKHQ